MSLHIQICLLQVRQIFFHPVETSIGYVSISEVVENFASMPEVGLFVVFFQLLVQFY